MPLLVLMVSSAQAPIIRARPSTGGSTCSHRPRQSKGTRRALGAGAGAAGAVAAGLATGVSGEGVEFIGEWKTALTMGISWGAVDRNEAVAGRARSAPGSGPGDQAWILKLSAYFFGSLPSQTMPSISLLLRIASLGTLTFKPAAACL